MGCAPPPESSPGRRCGRRSDGLRRFANRPDASAAPPPPVVNNAPVIRSIGVALSRVEVEQDVDVTAEVENTETNPDQLTYEWSATAGTFTGSGRTVRWRLPKGTTPTPVDVTITLTVIERYTEVVNSVVVTREHRVTSAASPFRAHDSDAELRRISIEFLVYLFGNSTISPSACLVDFSDSCRGKQDELRDIEHNRATFVILSAQATVGERVDQRGPDVGRRHRALRLPRSRDRERPRRHLERRLFPHGGLRT